MTTRKELNIVVNKLFVRLQKLPNSHERVYRNVRNKGRQVLDFLSLWPVLNEWVCCLCPSGPSEDPNGYPPTQQGTYQTVTMSSHIIDWRHQSECKLKTVHLVDYGGIWPPGGHWMSSIKLLPDHRNSQQHKQVATRTKHHTCSLAT